MIHRKPRAWQLDDDLYFGRHCQLVPAYGAVGYQYIPAEERRRAPLVFSGQAEAIWFQCGAPKQYGRRHIFKRRHF